MLISCTICSDLFTGNDSDAICCTPCGHLFHYICLMNWFERVKSCPQCRQKATEKSIVKLYFSLGTSGGGEEEAPDYLKNKVDNLTYQLRLKEVDVKNLKDNNEEYKLKNKSLLEHTKNVEDKVRNHETVVTSLQAQVKLLKNECREKSSKIQETQDYKEKLESLKHIDRLLHGSYEEGEEVLKNNKVNHDHLVRSLKLFKRETEEMRKKIKALKDHRGTREKKISDLESKLSALNREYRNVLATKVRLEEDLDHAEKEVVKWKNNCLALQKENESLAKPSSAKSSLMKRMILEVPAPAHLIGRNLDTDSPLNITTYDLTTPSPIEVPKVRSFMSKVKFDEPGCSKSFQKPTSSTANRSTPSSSIAFSDNRALMRKNRFTSDPWENIEIIKQSTANPDEVYDGLGGHSKVDRDVFPVPKPGPFKVKKRKVANLNIQCKKKNVDGNLPKISAFLKSYDLTGDDSE